jgi:hypothetical protein
LATYNKINSFVEAVAEKAHNLGADTLKVALSNTAVSAGMTVLANVTQIASGNGYTTGGKQATISASAQTAGTYKLTLADVIFTASGGTMASFRYVVLFNDTATNDELIGWWDYGSAVSLANTETFTVDFDATNGVLTIA